MAKSRDAFRTISEVADWLEVEPHVLRFWESKFSQIKPVKRAGGRRYYRPNDMVLISGIKKLLHEDGITIKGVQKILREEGVKHVSSLGKQVEVAAEPAKNAAPVVEAPISGAAPEQVEAEVIPIPVAEPEPEPVQEETAPEVATQAPDTAEQDGDDIAAATTEGDPNQLTVEPSPTNETCPEIETPAAPAPIVVDIPDDPADDAVAAAAGLGKLGAKTKDNAAVIKPLYDRLVALRARI